MKKSVKEMLKDANGKFEDSKSAEARILEIKTPYSVKDRVLLWVLNKHKKKGMPWTKSDEIVWKGGIYVVPTYIGFLVFAAVFGWLFIKTYDKYGMGKLICLIAITFLFRINTLIKELHELNQKL